MSEKSSLALIIPCYNEEESIPEFGVELAGFISAFNGRLPGWTLSVLVVDNNSTDKSLKLLLDLQKQHDCLSVIVCPTQGYGAALKLGFASSSSHYLSFLDLDNTYPMVSLFDMYETLKNENSDIVYGVRIHQSSQISLIRNLGNRFYVYMLKFLFNSTLTDVCSGMRIFKGTLKNGILDLKTDDLSFSIDFTSFALVNNWKISEYPISYRNRTGASKLSVIRDGYLFLKVVIGNYFKKKSKNA